MPDLSSLTGPAGYFEDFTAGRRLRHARGATVGEVENNFITKQVMNTAQAHWNEHFLTDGPLGSGRVVFGLVTASIVFGLASQDVAEQALASKAKEVIVVTGHQAELVEEALKGLKVKFVSNPDFAEGLSTSVRTGVAALGKEIDAAIVQLGDMPGVNSALLDRLMAAMKKYGR